MVNNLEWKLVNTFSLFSPLKFQDIPKGTNEDFADWCRFQKFLCVGMIVTCWWPQKSRGTPNSIAVYLTIIFPTFEVPSFGAWGFKLYFPKVRSSGCELWYHSHESPGRSVGEAMGDHEDMLFGHVTPNSRGSKGILLGMWRLGKCDGIHLKLEYQFFLVVEICRKLRMVRSNQQPPVLHRR